MDHGVVVLLLSEQTFARLDAKSLTPASEQHMFPPRTCPACKRRGKKDAGRGRCDCATFTAGWGRRGFSGAGRRGRKRPRWIDTVPPTAWNRIHEDPDSAPLHRDPHNRPLTTDDLPFNPHFHSNPFAFPNFSDQFDFVPLRVVSQHRHFWRESVVRAPTRANSSLFGGSDPHEGECAPGT